MVSPAREGRITVAPSARKTRPQVLARATPCQWRSSPGTAPRGNQPRLAASAQPSPWQPPGLVQGLPANRILSLPSPTGGWAV